MGELKRWWVHGITDAVGAFLSQGETYDDSETWGNETIDDIDQTPLYLAADADKQIENLKCCGNCKYAIVDGITLDCELNTSHPWRNELMHKCDKWQLNDPE